MEITGQLEMKTPDRTTDEEVTFNIGTEDNPEKNRSSCFWMMVC